MPEISEVEPIILYNPRPDDPAPWASYMVLVRVVTKDGGVGWGETLSSIRVNALVQLIKVLSSVMRGRDVFNLEGNRLEWYRQDFNMPVSLESTAAYSAFDIASWDIIGRELGAPVHRLLGGLTRDRVRVYANGWYSNAVKPEDFAEKAKETVRRGYTALKFDPFGPYFDMIDSAGIKDAAERVKAVREAVGDGVDILIEAHGRFNAESAIRAAWALEPYNPLFMEEPVHPEDIEGLIRFRNSTRIRVALGERIINKGYLIQYLKLSLVDYLQTDVGRFGGLTEARKASIMAEAFSVPMAFHNANGPILHAATIQLDASIPNFAVQESFYDYWPQWKRDLVGDSMPVENGYVKVPTKPGLGVDVNEKLIERLRINETEITIKGGLSWIVKGTTGGS
ncbi:mandelate racemase/muconate lactonizing enzyme family protein [Caldivirga maquilingensis]|uniref:gluconate dehydratase n=1 Tax=Caldivirga maquilingensis (strain ATCC 700844 / DSM 13496 / JCM 10307 / IC-167) TaxID=397948 RepID=A8M9P7_CALMQ|nr:mandelate racemase/muconate lactonizing enzyme family protein [Caldivirga maquilingensis]ABW00928.1 Mandelate racemase/muconate lactonizing protein [Caldivirga maquilingensis IC-167]